MQSAPSNCILCNSPNRSVLIRKGDWTAFKCDNCGLGFLDPRPDPTELNQLYKESYFQSHYDKGLQVNSLEMRRRISQEDHRIRFFRSLKKNGRLVDIGCGMGYFLYASRMYGYDVEGVDISDYAASYIMDELKIPVRIGSIEEIDFEDQSVDMITMWHFLEHTPSPEDYLKKAWVWLKPGGLMIVDVPNYEGTDAKKTWAEWPDWDFPYHLYHFTPNALKTMLSKHGFKIIRTKNYHSEYIKNKLGRIPVISLFARLIAKGFSGSGLAVVAQRDMTSS